MRKRERNGKKELLNKDIAERKEDLARVRLEDEEYRKSLAEKAAARTVAGVFEPPKEEAACVAIENAQLSSTQAWVHAAEAQFAVKTEELAQLELGEAHLEAEEAHSEAEALAEAEHSEEEARLLETLAEDAAALLANTEATDLSPDEVAAAEQNVDNAKEFEVASDALAKIPFELADIEKRQKTLEAKFKSSAADRLNLGTQENPRTKAARKNNETKQLGAIAKEREAWWRK